MSLRPPAKFNSPPVTLSLESGCTHTHTNLPFLLRSPVYTHGNHGAAPSPQRLQTLIPKLYGLRHQQASLEAPLRRHSSPPAEQTTRIGVLGPAHGPSSSLGPLREEAGTRGSKQSRVKMLKYPEYPCTRDTFILEILAKAQACSWVLAGRPR